MNFIEEIHKSGYSAEMKKSGKTNRCEPTDTSWESEFPNCAALFKRAGWFTFFERITGFNTEASYRFAQGFNNDTVTFDTLKFELIEELIARATSIARDGELWFKKIPFTFNPKYFLVTKVEGLDRGKGVQLDKFKPEWREFIRILQSHITCEGRFGLVFKYHVRFLQHLNQ